jgi:hypothetical protein
MQYFSKTEITNTPRSIQRVKYCSYIMNHIYREGDKAQHCIQQNVNPPEPVLN